MSVHPFPRRFRHTLRRGWLHRPPSWIWRIIIPVLGALGVLWALIEAGGYLASGLTIALVSSMIVGEILFAAEQTWLLAGIALCVLWRRSDFSLAEARRNGAAHAYARAYLIPGFLVFGAGLPCLLFWLADVPIYFKLLGGVWVIGLFHRHMLTFLGQLINSKGGRIGVLLVLAGVVGWALDPALRGALVLPMILLVIGIIALKNNPWKSR